MKIEETRFFTVAAPDEFLAGMRDCRDGKPHTEGRHPDYDRGYAVEHERDEVMSEISRQSSLYRRYQ